MADQNPMGDGVAVALTIPPEHLKFLRPLLEMVHDGIREELQTHADSLREPARLRREEEALVSLLAALSGGRVRPNAELGALLVELAESTDAANDYSRVLAEHDAFSTLLCQIEGALA